MVESHNHNGINSSVIGIEDIIAKGSDGAVLKWGENGVYWENAFADEIFQIIDYDFLQISDDANVSVTEASYTLKKTKTINEGPGTLTVKFDIYGEGTSGIVWGILYKNGSEVSETEESTNAGVTKTITKSISVTTGDTFDVYGKLTVGAVPNARVSNFRFYFLKTITPEGAI